LLAIFALPGTGKVIPVTSVTGLGLPLTSKLKCGRIKENREFSKLFLKKV
jgi:hypothetical protein